MTEKELKTMYDKMALSEERLSELEKRLDDCFDHAPEGFQDLDGDELLHFDSEYKPAPRRRSPLKIALTSAAAAVVVAGGLTAAFMTGLIPVGTSSPESSAASETSEPAIIATAETQENTDPAPVVKHGITSADLPEYPNQGILDTDRLKLDPTTYDETAANDIRSLNLKKTVLIAEMTVTDCDYEWGSGDTVYTVTVDEVYYINMGIHPKGTTIKLLMPGRLDYQYEGCPLYAEGDRFFAALCNGERFYEVSAAQTIADIITINGKDYAAAHSKYLPVMTSFAGENVLTYDRTVTQNPALYYGLYDLEKYGEYYAGIAEHSESSGETTGESFDISRLSFYADAEVLTEIFEPNFFGRWLLNETGSDWDFYNNIYLEYSTDEYYPFKSYPDIFRPLNGMTCGGFSMDAKAFYMLDYTNGANVWVIWKDEPGTLYRYEGVGRHERSDYLVSYRRIGYGDVTKVSARSSITPLGLLKVLSEYDSGIEVRALANEPEFRDGALEGTLTGAVIDVLENGSTEYAGITWKRTNIDRYSLANIYLPEEENWLFERSADKLSLTVRLFNADEKWRESAVADVSDTCRYFRVDFTRTDSGWTWEYSPLSGDPSDMENFFSPLNDTYMYLSYMMSDRAHPDKEVTVEYYAVENNGQTDIYAMRKIKDIFAGTDEYDIYYRDPCTDYYNLLAYGPTLAFCAEDSGSVLIGHIYDNTVHVTRYRSGYSNLSTTAGQAQDGRIELIPHGDFVVVGFDFSGSGRYTVLERSSLFVCGGYEQKLLKITDDSLEVLNEYDNKYTKIELTDELQIRAVEKKAQLLWAEFDIESPAGTGLYMVVKDGHSGKVIADPELRTYDGIKNLFSEVYTDEAVTEAMGQITGQSILEVDGRTYTTEGARGADIDIWGVGFTIPEETFTDTTAVLEFTITYWDPDTGSTLDRTDTYTINAVKTENGWRLDRFYYPY